MGSVIAAGYMALKSKYEIQLTGLFTQVGARTLQLSKLMMERLRQQRRIEYLEEEITSETMRCVEVERSNRLLRLAAGSSGGSRAEVR